MTATELIHSALEHATPFVPRAKVVSVDRFANETIQREREQTP